MIHSTRNRGRAKIAVARAIGAVAGVVLVTITSAAVAQTTPQSINVGGSAAQICSLPSQFSFQNGSGPTAGSFSGSVWEIPSASIATGDGLPVGGTEISVRISGMGFCNTPHEIHIRSTNGALRRNGMRTAPAGFAIQRGVEYDAHWADPASRSRRYGPGIYGWRPPAPNSGSSIQWTADDGIPGARPFDVRLAVRQDDGVALPLVAGAYSDTVSITLTPLP